LRQILSQTTYRYDDLNRRIGKDVASDANATETYIYDGTTSNLLLTLDGDGNVKERDFFGPGANEALAQEIDGTTQWLQADHQNGPILGV
jgi:hypothetical protein